MRELKWVAWKTRELDTIPIKYLPEHELKNMSKKHELWAFQWLTDIVGTERVQSSF